MVQGNRLLDIRIRRQIRPALGGLLQVPDGLRIILDAHVCHARLVISPSRVQRPCLLQGLNCILDLSPLGINRGQIEVCLLKVLLIRSKKRRENRFGFVRATQPHVHERQHVLVLEVGGLPSYGLLYPCKSLRVIPLLHGQQRPVISLRGCSSGDPRSRPVPCKDAKHGQEHQSWNQRMFSPQKTIDHVCSPEGIEPVHRPFHRISERSFAREEGPPRAGWTVAGPESTIVSRSYRDQKTIRNGNMSDN